MLNAGLVSPWPPPKTRRSIEHTGEGMPLTRQSDILNDIWYGRRRGAVPQQQLQRIGLPVRLPFGRIDFEGRQWQGPAGVNAASPALSENMPLTEEAEGNGWLNDALAELADCPAAAVEEGLEGPSKNGLEKAAAMLRMLSAIVEEQPDIYPMEGGGIVIDLRSPDLESSVLMVVESDSAGALFYRASGKKGRARVDDAADLPNLLRALGLPTVKATETR